MVSINSNCTTTMIMPSSSALWSSNRKRLKRPLMPIDSSIMATIIMVIMLMTVELSQCQQSSSTIKLQRFLIEPENVTVDIGESIILPCRIANKVGTVQWTRDDFGLGADPRLEGFPTYSMMHNDVTGDYSLKISSVTLEDDARFQCQVGASDKPTNIPGIRSQYAQLTVRVRPDNPVIVMDNHFNRQIQIPSPYHHHLQQQQQNNLQHREDVPILSTTVGNKIELTCESNGGRPAAELVWINSKNRPVKKGIETKITPMNDGKRFNTMLKWTFEPTKNDHQKRLFCRLIHPTIAANNDNSSMASIMLEVKYAPEVKLDITRIASAAVDGNASPPSLQSLSVFGATNLHGRSGDRIRIRCQADGNPGGSETSMQYEWLRNNEPIIGDYSNELIIDQVDKSFNGAEIQCKVTNSIGSGKSSVKLNIAYGPSFPQAMQYVYGCDPGDTVRLSCPADGNPSPEITWIKVGTSSVISTGSKLTLRNVREENIGEYLCRVSVKGFSEISAIIYLRFNGPPKIRKASSLSSKTLPSSYHSLLYPFNDNNVGHNRQQQHQSSLPLLQNNRFYAVLGEPGHLECLIESIPEPLAVTWIHNGQIFVAKSPGNIPTNIDIREEIIQEQPVYRRLSFDIRQTFENDFGYYNCVVVNSYGSDWYLVSLEAKTSFSTYVIVVAIAIAILMFVVLITILLLLSIKHRNLMKQQQQHQKQPQHNQSETESMNDVGKDVSKEHYMVNLDSENPHHHNIYSTNSTTTARTNSSSDKNGTINETGTVITRSGSTITEGSSKRSSTSSTFPFHLDSQNPHHHDASSLSPGPNGIISRTINSLHQRRYSPHQQTMFSSNDVSHLPHYHHHFQQHRPTSPPPSFFANSMFDNTAASSNNDAAESDDHQQIVSMPPPLLSSTSNYSTLTRHLQSMPSNRNSYSPYLAQQQQFCQQQRFDNHNAVPSSTSADMYPPYSQSPITVTAATNRLRSTPMPTPTPSLAKELDNCISKTSIATHV
uniref:Irregular chiasm C-roughest protein-like isoform X2 n=1 Tax=Dermatophagoides pteronyssinus TaxID=6956 RepID=A0A6P6YIJ5_DERPT|nr:irregular chiasm C-roughest protein-like isoform X2 [Dermatophagoides pteronyssinus]